MRGRGDSGPPSAVRRPPPPPRHPARTSHPGRHPPGHQQHRADPGHDHCPPGRSRRPAPPSGTTQARRALTTRVRRRPGCSPQPVSALGPMPEGLTITSTPGRGLAPTGSLLKDTQPASLVAASPGPQTPSSHPAAQVRQALTDREQDVFSHIAAGMSNSEIAASLFLSEGTVKIHVGRILAKLGLRDRVPSRRARLRIPTALTRLNGCRAYACRHGRHAANSGPEADVGRADHAITFESSAKGIRRARLTGPRRPPSGTGPAEKLVCK